MKWFVVCVLAVCVAGGCARKAPIDEVLQTVQDELQTGAVDAAVARLTDALEDDAYEADRGRLFAILINLLVEQERIDDAREAFKAMMARDMALVGPALGAITRSYRVKQEYEAVREWTAELLGFPLPDGEQERVHAWHLEATIRAGHVDGVMAAIPDTTAIFGAADFVPLLTYLARAFRDQGQLEECVDYVSALRDANPDNEALAAFLLASEMDLLKARDRWDEVEPKFREACATMPDVQLRSTLTSMLQAAMAAEQWDLVQRVCAFALAELEARPTTYREAGRYWIRVAHTVESPVEVLSRMDALLDRGFPAPTLLASYREVIYDILQRKDEELTRHAVAIGRRLDPLLVDELDRGALTHLLFDSAFMIDDYETMLASLEDGILGKEEAWHAMARNKVLAHKAQKEGNLAEAVKRFRDFTDHVEATWTEPQTDPSTQLSFTREMALGLNRVRVGRLLEKMGDTEQAASEFAAAREYYRQALLDFPAESAEANYVTEQSATIPEAVEQTE